MTESRRVFDVEFKLNVAQMVVDQGQSVKDVAKAMGLGETAVRRWAEQYKNNRLGKVVAGTPLTAEQLRIRQLEQRNRELEEEVTILKKATAYFARSLK